MRINKYSVARQKLELKKDIALWARVDPNQVKAVDERFWSWIFREDDGPNHPLKVSNGGEAQERIGNMLILAGSLQGGGQKDRSLRIPAGVESIFVLADGIVSTDADGDGVSDRRFDQKSR